MKELKTLTKIFLILTCSILFMGCPNNEDDQESVSSVERRFVGAWDIRNINYIIFSEDKQVVYYEGSDDNERYKHGMWSYDDNTKILSTSINSKKGNLQWKITLSYDNEWSGINLWDESKGTSTAKRLVGKIKPSYKVGPSPVPDIYLMGRKWGEQGKNGTYFKYKHSSYLSFKDAGYGQPEDIFAQEDTVTINYEYGGPIKVVHPYNFSKSYITKVSQVMAHLHNLT